MTGSSDFPYLQIGKVLKRESNNLVDVSLVNGGILYQVPVASNNAGTKQGRTYIPATTVDTRRGEITTDPVTKKTTAADGVDLTGDRDTYAVIGYLSGSVHNPVVLAFLFPDDAEMFFDEEGLLIDRHENNFYTLMDAIWSKDSPHAKGEAPTIGNYEFVSPDGSFIKIGDSTTKRDLTGQDVNESWDIPVQPAKYIHIEHTSGTKITIKPDGDIEIVGVKDQKTTIANEITETSLDKTVSVTNGLNQTVGEKTEVVNNDSTETVGNTKTIGALTITENSSTHNLITTTLTMQAETANLAFTTLDIVSPTVNIESSTLMVLNGKQVLIGSAPTFSVMLSEPFLAKYLAHQHLDPVTGTTGPPTDQDMAGVSSTSVKVSI